MSYEQVRSLAYATASRLDAGLDPQERARLTSALKFEVAKAGRHIGQEAVQLHGGDGVRQGQMVESLYREIRALRIYEGASDVQRVVIARQTLGGR